MEEYGYCDTDTKFIRNEAEQQVGAETVCRRFVTATFPRQAAALMDLLKLREERERYPPAECGLDVSVWRLYYRPQFPPVNTRAIRHVVGLDIEIRTKISL